MKVVAEVVRKLNDRTFEAGLCSGHRLIGVVPKKMCDLVSAFVIGARVTVFVVPFDMSKGVLVDED